MIAIAPRIPFAELRTNQLGSWESFSQLPTRRFAGPRPPTHNCAQTSCERFSQLPPQHRAGVRSATQKPVVNEKSFHNVHNLNFTSRFSGLSPISSCGGETPILTDGEEGACGYAWRLLLLPPVRCFRARACSSTGDPTHEPTPTLCHQSHRLRRRAPHQNGADARGSAVRTGRSAEACAPRRAPDHPVGVAEPLRRVRCAVRGHDGVKDHRRNQSPLPTPPHARARGH
jgi:hypothetical protein